MRRLSQIKLVLFFFFSLHVLAEAAEKIRITIPDTNAAYMTFPLAQKRGFLTHQGFAAEVLLMRGTLTVPALNNGDIDYHTGLPLGVRGAIAGFPLKIVACYLPRSSLMVVSRPDINSVQDLKGKTVAVSSFGSTNSGALQLIAKHFGLDAEKRHKTLGCGANEARLAALKQGIVAAIVVPPPWDFHAKKLGFHVIARSYEFFSYPQVGLIVNESKIKQRPGRN